MFERAREFEPHRRHRCFAARDTIIFFIVLCVMQVLGSSATSELLINALLLSIVSRSLNANCGYRVPVSRPLVRHASNRIFLQPTDNQCY